MWPTTNSPFGKFFLILLECDFYSDAGAGVIQGNKILV